MPSSIAYVPALDGLRAVAIALVVARHVWPESFPGGRVGVDVFFVLSGYLITMILWREHVAHGQIDTRTFLRRRCRRLLPALYVGIPLILLFFILTGPWAHPTVSAVSALLMLSAFTVALNVTGVFMHAWSLSVEWWFYVLCPTYVAWARSVHWTVAAAAFTAVAATGYIAMAMMGGRVYFLRAGGLVLGAVLALIVMHHAVRHTGLLAAAGFAAVLSACLSTQDMGWAYPLAALGTMAMIPHLNATTLLSRILAWSPAVWLGVISYEVYLIHYPLVKWCLHRQDDIGHTAAIGAALLSVPLAWLLHRFTTARWGHSRISRVPVDARS